MEEENSTQSNFENLDSHPLTVAEQLKLKKEKEQRMNQIMKAKMDLIQTEMTKFTDKNDSIVSLCDSQMRQLVA